MRWLKLLAMGATAACALLACACGASAQVPRPGYIFAEVMDEADKPVAGAVAVVYNAAGDEVRSSLSDSTGRVNLLVNRRGQERFVFRIVKRGYVTHEGAFETSGEYKDAAIQVKLISLHKSKASVERRRLTPLLNLRRMLAWSSPPPKSRRVRTVERRASASTFLRGHPT